MNKRKNRLWKQLISIMLAIALVVTSVEVSALAAPAEEVTTEEVTEGAVTEESVTEEAGAGETDESVEETVDELSEQESTEEAVPEEEIPEEAVPEQEQTPEQLILTEVEEEREEDSKTFLLNDGNFMVAQYGTPIHYADEEGNWEEIDTSVTETDTGTEEEGYETTEKAGNRDRIKFSKKLKEGKTISIKNTEFPISWGFVGAEKQTVEILEEAEESEETTASAETSEDTEKVKAKKHNDKFLRFDDSSEVLLYADIYEDVDVTYEVKSSGIKENLILKQAGTKTVYEIAYDIGKLEAVQADTQTINLMNGEEIVYQIQAPYMADDAGNRSEEVSVAITELKNKKMTVTVEADEEWLADEERVYPVILDPVILTKTDRDSIDSTFVASGQSSTNFSGKLELLVGKESSSYKNCRTLVKFTLPTLNPGDMVVDADLNLYLYQMD